MTGYFCGLVILSWYWIALIWNLNFEKFEFWLLQEAIMRRRFGVFNTSIRHRLRGVDFLCKLKWRRVFILISWFMCMCLFISVYDLFIYLFIYLFRFMYWKSRWRINPSYEYLAWIKYVNFTWALKNQIKIKQIEKYIKRCS